jgi:hypothetical protein
MLHCLEIEFLGLFASCVTVSSISAASFTSMCSTQADNNSRKSWLRCRCQFPWCALGLTLNVLLQNVLTAWDCPRHHTPCLPIVIPVYTNGMSGATSGHVTHCCIMLGLRASYSTYKDTGLAGRMICPEVLVGSDCIQRLMIEHFVCILF